MGRRAVFAALFVTAFLMLARAHLYASRPVFVLRAGLYEFDAEAWSRRDWAMGAPRAAALALCLGAMAALGGLRRWGWAGRVSPAAVLLLTGAGAGIVLSTLRQGPPLFDHAQTVRGLWATVLVASWEEACYRGLLYRGLRESLSGPRAAAASSAAFMFMHLQAQPFEAWPFLFCFGVAACAAAEEGAGLTALVAMHWLADAAFFWTGTEGTEVSHLVGRAALVAAAAWGTYRLSGAAPRTAGEGPDTPAGSAPATPT